MIDEQYLSILRCPIDPEREAKLFIEDEIRVLCSRCRVHFKVREGFVSLVVEEAALPADCPNIDSLPCRLSNVS